MRIPARLLVLALIAVPAVPALAATTSPATTTTTTAVAAPVLVARYTFDAGAPAGRVADTSGRGAALTVRTADRGTVRVLAATGGGRYIGLPLRCAAGATTCPRALLEGTDDADLDPGTRRFTWGATVLLAKSQLAGSANVVQKGVATTESQWKMQVGATHGRAQCVVVGRGSTRAYVVRSTVTVADGKWHRVMCRRSGSTLTVTVDGTVRGSATIPAALTISNNKPLRVAGPNFNTNSDMYHGFLDNVYAQLG